MDNSPDHWQQQQLEEERQQKIVAILDRICTGMATRRDAVAIAAECGIQYSPRKRKVTRKPLIVEKKGKVTVADMSRGHWFILKRTGQICQYRKPSRQDRHVCRTWVEPVRDVTLAGGDEVMRIDPPMRPLS